MALFEAVEQFPSLPQQTTAVLTAALAHLAQKPVDEAAIWQLAIADRQFLMRALAHHLKPGPRWYSANCQQCENRFDFQLDDNQLPITAAAASYPFTEVSLNQAQYRLRTPTGADQLAIAQITDATEARHHLASLCLIDGPQEPLSGEQVAQIETALEDLGPMITETIAANCPDCNHQQSLSIDPYRLLTRPNDAVFGDVCLLAARFHWSEADILALPTSRRQHYVRMFDRQRGMQE